MKFYTVYILKCSDGSFYVGVTNNVEKRLSEHQSGLSPTAYTYKRRPVELVYTKTFTSIIEAINFEKKLKGWSRNKKQALIDENWTVLRELSKNSMHKNKPNASQQIPQIPYLRLMELTPEIIDKIQKLQEKYAAMGQDMSSYLDGLLHADFLTYWDYIHLDTLLSLQTPKTRFPDEEIFIMYHQISELYFKLSLHELQQLAEKTDLDPAFFTARLKRINAYFKALTTSFEVMVEGMEKEQFLKFRMSLLPASGFQSAQYRMIEISATDFVRLVAPARRETLAGAPIETQFADIYWKSGATELSSGQQTLTLRQFIHKYEAALLQLARDRQHTNLAARYRALKAAGHQNLQELEDQLRLLDLHVNVEWPLSHYKSAVRYLERDPIDIAATGGTNWQKYLPPRFQKRIFYPFLWTDQQQDEWGKGWVMQTLAELRSNR